MKKTSIFVLIATLGSATLLLSGISDNAVNNLKKEINPHTMAAFRDGLYQAQLHAKRGGQPHVATGRWQQAEDQSLFVAGYRQGYAEFYASHPDLKEQQRNLEIERVQFGQRSGMPGVPSI